MKITNITTQEQLNNLYNQSALTWEGLGTSEDNLKEVINWLESHKVDCTNIEFNITKGTYMNTAYNLTGSNAYPSNLNIVSVTGIDVTPIIIPRFEVGGRWFDDIVNNNAAREEHETI